MAGPDLLWSTGVGGRTFSLLGYWTPIWPPNLNSPAVAPVEILADGLGFRFVPQPQETTGNAGWKSRNGKWNAPYTMVMLWGHFNLTSVWLAGSIICLSALEFMGGVLSFHVLWNGGGGWQSSNASRNKVNKTVENETPVVHMRQIS